MDPLFERRELTKKINISSKFLQKNMISSLMAQIRMNFEGRCLPEGFVQPNSSTIVDYSLGRTNYIKGGIDYDVKFQADVCMPHAGQRFRAPISVRSKVGLHAETPPIKVLIPRDLHIGNEEFENVKVGEEVEFEVIGSTFKQQDKTIVVIAKLLSKVKQEVEQPLLASNVAPPAEAVVEAPAGDSEVKQVVTTQESEKPKKRKLRQNVTSEPNESVKAGEP